MTTYMYLNDQTEEGTCSYLLLLTDETLWGVLSQVSEFLKVTNKPIFIDGIGFFNLTYEKKNLGSFTRPLKIEITNITYI